MPAVKVVKGNQLHLFVPSARRSKSVPPGHADVILEFIDLVRDRGGRKWVATFTVLEAAKRNEFKVYQDVLISDPEGFYALSFQVVRSGNWPEINVTFFRPEGSKSRETQIYLVKDAISHRKEVRFSSKSHPAQKKRW